VFQVTKQSVDVCHIAVLSFFLMLLERVWW